MRKQIKDMSIGQPFDSYGIRWQLKERNTTLQWARCVRVKGPNDEHIAASSPHFPGGVGTTAPFDLEEEYELC
jgi:hypothetical protein